MSHAARGTFEELLNGTAPELAAIARRLREAIFAVDPAAVETVRLGDNAATYGVGPKKMTEGYAYIMPMRGYVNLGFYQGASLEDARLEGTGKGPHPRDVWASTRWAPDGEKFGGPPASHVLPEPQDVSY